MRKLLVTGGAGFIGANFVHYWLANHPADRVVVLDALTYAGNIETLKPLMGKPNFRFVKGNICNSELVELLLREEQCDTLVHFAAESHVDRSISGPDAFIETNIIGTHSLLKAARAVWLADPTNPLPHRFHHVSTDEVYGELSLRSKRKFNEKIKFSPRSPYSASKAGSDHLVLSYYHTYGLPVTITNCSNNYGAYQYPEKFIPRMITNLLEERKIPIYGDGRYVRDWLYVEDHARAIEAVLLSGKPGQTYCVGGLAKDVSNLELAKMILKIMGKNEDFLEFVADRAGHDRRYAVDWGKIEDELGWKPKETIESGLEKTVFWYQQNESWWREKKEEAEKFYQKLAAKKR